ncbi:hypothetical protein QJS04_geneDACA010473 [Acorus gramineus]|uniref:Pectinesterase inhibitor domain-containing protein n=1 Tax=Acorus gramineus TaxID=55184 RepID=A0AAV9AMB7_ACOGR|nr:hypothetical protein QJS04_geneDACA010473 [Acorus gramineus]
MKTHHHLLLLLLLTLLSLSLPNTTTSQPSSDPTIDQFCEDLVDQKLCVYVLESDSNRNDSDYRNLSLIAFNFTRKYIADTLNYAQFLAAKVKGSEFEASLNRCVALYQDSYNIMSTNVSEAIGAGRYANAVTLLQHCRDNSVACESKFEPQPDPLSTDNERTMLLLKITAWIITLLKW